MQCGCGCRLSLQVRTRYIAETGTCGFVYMGAGTCEAHMVMADASWLMLAAGSEGGGDLQPVAGVPGERPHAAARPGPGQRPRRPPAAGRQRPQGALQVFAKASIPITHPR